MDNQRFKKLCRLPQLGVYVDEAHHLFGANLEKELRSGGANKTTLRNTINMLAEATSIVACYNYTGTPYVKRQVLPEVVYAYGLRDSISHGFLKDADPIGFDNVKNEEFLKKSITMFWERYGGKTYEGLPPKMAIFAANVAEATDVVRPAVEKILGELNVSLDTILVNTGDTTVTKNDDIRDFNNLDVLGTEGSRKQFIVLVEKGREGWNCRSLLGIALFRSPKSKIFVLQATMRCLRKLTDEQLKATVFLSKENLDTLDEELRNNYNMEIKDLGQSSDKKKNSYKVRVLPPPRSIKMKRIWHEYSLIEKEYSEPIDFKVSEIDDAKYESKMYEKGSIRLELSTKETVIDDIKNQMRYSRFSLVGEISRYMNLSCVLISRILSEAIDGFDNLVEAVNKHNEVLDDVIIPKIFNTLYEVKSEQKNEDVDVILLKEPKDSGYYEFSADENLVIEKDYNSFTPEEIKKSFHADTYCFDSKPEKECFLQYISSKKVKEIYFTGMTKYLMIPTINAVKPDILKLNSAIVTSDIPTFEFKSVDLTQLEPYIQNPNRNAVRMLLKTLAYEHQDDLLPAKWEIEHIFPQKWQTNYFPDEPDATIKEKIEHIGNKLPFEKKLNIVAGNGYFGKKKKEYTASKIVITKAMGTSDVMDWNLESITKRDIRVSDEVVKIMNRWNNEYLNISISEGKMGEPSEEELAQIEKFKKNGWI